MNRLLLIVIILVVAVGAFLLLGNRSNQPATIQSQAPTNPVQSTNESEAAIITLDETEFSPNDITVKVGARVVWINKSGENATVNSADHPTHQVYPRLNLGEFGSGSSVQLVFDETGTYSYHNHLNASQTGTVTVE